MKTTTKLLAVLALALATFMQHSTASAAARIYMFRGKPAHAWFTSIEGCIQTDVFVSAAETAYQAPLGQLDSSVFLYIFQYDFCTSTYLIYGDGFAFDDVDLQISNQLESATLNTTVSFNDYVSNTTFDVSVDLAWAGTGPLTRDIDTFHIRSEGCIANGRFKGISRLAEASGTVSYAGTNFTPETSIYALLGSAQNGNVVIGCE